MANTGKLPLTKELGKRIRKIREEKKLTQEETAYRAGLDFSFFNQIENGLRNPSVTTVESIAKALNIRLKDLFD